MTPTAVRMVLVEGADGGGVTLDSNVVDVPIGDAGHSGAAEQVVAAILGTRESVDEGAHRLAAIGVAWTDHADGRRLRQALRADDISDVVMVSELHAASALAQAVGRTIGYERTALLFVEASDPDPAGAVARRLTVTMAVVRTVDGAVVAVQTRASNADDIAADLQDVVAALELAAEPPQAVFLIGAGLDVAALSARIAEGTPLPVHAPDDADLALARGAALAAAGTPRFEAETVAVAAGSAGSTGRFGSAADTVAGATQMAPAGYMAPLGYSAVIDDDDDAVTPDIDESPADESGLFAESELTDESGLTDESDESEEKPFLLVGSTLATIFVVGVVALVISLAVSIRPAVEQRPGETRTPAVPTAAGEAAETGSSTALETIQAPVPVVREAPRTAFAPAPAARPQPPVPAAPAGPASVLPAAPAAPAPVLPAASAPVPPAASAPVVTVPAAPVPAIPPIVLAPMIPVLPPFVQAPVRIPTLPATVAPSVTGPSTTGPPTTAPSVTTPSTPTTPITATVAPTSTPTSSEAPAPTVTSEAPAPTVTSEAPAPAVSSEVLIPSFSVQSSGDGSGSEE